MVSTCASTPQPPYLAVIFTSLRRQEDDGYAEMAQAMETLAARQDGYLGHESAHGSDGFGITVSYWRDEDAVSAWKKNTRHEIAQKLGHERWYEAFNVRIAKVERAYTGPRRDQPTKAG